MSAVRRPHPYVLITLATITIACALTLVNVYQRRAADRTARQSANAAEMLTAMLDQETSLRGFALHPREVFLEPYLQGRTDFARELAESRADLGEDSQASRLLDAQAAAAAAWQRDAASTITDIRAGGRSSQTTARALQRKSMMDRFRALNGDYQRLVDDRRDRGLNEAAFVAVAIVVLLVALFATLGVLMVRRRIRADVAREAEEARFRAQQDEFADMLAVADDEHEAHSLLKRHLERSAENVRVVVLNRNNSEDRLESRTELVPGGPIATALESAAPRDCLAVRLAKPHDESEESPALLQCRVCGRKGSASTCVPLLVSGAVIGSVLVEHPKGFHETERRRLQESVAQAAPVLANLRNLAMAEQRAATDVLTGLPNRRALQDTMKRMLAQASRTVTPLSAIVLDLDRFKRINDQYGHERGDQVLAAVGETINHTIRASDFAGRNGGEEFLLLLPDTTTDGAVTLAEKLRLAIRALDIPGLDRAVSASFGIATFPIDATDSESLVRVADRALYLAKHNGRDRIETAPADEELVSSDLDAGDPR